MLMYLRLLRNRYDDEALVTVLASPFVGVSNDALVLIRRHAGRRPLFTGIERSLPGGARRRRPPADPRLQAALRRGSSPLRRASRSSGSASWSSPRTTTTSPCSPAPAGKRRYANLRKLMRLARSYEELRGRDIEGFVALHPRPGSARRRPARGGLARRRAPTRCACSRFMRAKGLEFKVVVVADAGRDHGSPAGRRRDPGALRRPLRLQGRASDNERAPSRCSPTTRCSRPSVQADRAERFRLFYVAMTRAKDRLLVSGAIDDEREDADRVGALASSIARTSSRAAKEPFELERGGASFLVRVDRPRARAAAERGGAGSRRPSRAVSSSCSLTLPTAPIERGWRLPELAPIPEPPLHRVRRLSYSALALFERCSYRYYAERVAGLRERRTRGPGRHGSGCDGDRRRRAPAARARRPRARRRCPMLELVRAWYPDVTRRRARADRSVRDGLLRVRARAAGRGARRSAARAAVRLRARRRAPPRPARRAPSRRRAGARRSTTRRTCSASAHRTRSSKPTTGCSGSSTRSPASGPAPRRSRSSTHSSSARMRVVSTTFDACRDRGARAASFRRRSPASTQGEFMPTPSDFTCAGCPALDVVCAGPASRWRLVAPARGPRGHLCVDGEELRPRGRKKVGPKRDRIRPIIDAPRRRPRRRADRASLPQPARAARLGDALGADDRRERQPRDREALRRSTARPRTTWPCRSRSSSSDIFQTGFFRQKAKGAARDDADPDRGARGRGADRVRRAAAPPGRRAQDRERRLRRARRRTGDRRRHACAPALPAARLHASRRIRSRSSAT